MKKYILSLVLVIVLFVSFEKVFASGESDICFEERKVIVKKGYTAFMPPFVAVPNNDGALRPTYLTPSTNIEAKYFEDRYGENADVYKSAFQKRSTSVQIKVKYTGSSGVRYVEKTVTMTKEQWDAIKTEIEALTQKAADEYNSVVEKAKKDLENALAKKLAECNKLELDFVEKTITKPVEKISEKIVEIPASCDTTASDETISSLKIALSNLRATNTSLSQQVSTLQAQLLASQNENLTLRNSLQVQKKEPIAKVTPTIKPESAVSDAPKVPIPVVETPAPAKKGVWQRLTGWLR